VRNWGHPSEGGEIVARTARPAPERLEAQLLAFRPQIERHVRALVRDRADPEELTQDAYARAFSRSDELRDPQAALAWLYRIATNVCLDRLRQRRPPTVLLDTQGSGNEGVAGTRGGETPTSETQTALERSEMSECVQKYLETIPDDYRAVIYLHDVYDLSNPEIAELLDCSVATAKIRLHRARVRLRGILAAACTFEIDERGVMVCDPVSSPNCGEAAALSCSGDQAQEACCPRPSDVA
jgi:RNA polymerase sigma-70 factor, ECF subfamily